MLPGCTDWEIRLVNGTHASEGQLEVCRGDVGVQFAEIRGTVLNLVLFAVN